MSHFNEVSLWSLFVCYSFGYETNNGESNVVARRMSYSSIDDESILTSGLNRDDR